MTKSFTSLRSFWLPQEEPSWGPVVFLALFPSGSTPEPGIEEVYSTHTFDWLTAWLSRDRFTAVVSKQVNVWSGPSMCQVLHVVWGLPRSREKT